MFSWVEEGTYRVPWGFSSSLMPPACLAHVSSSHQALDPAGWRQRTCGTGPQADTLVPWGMPGLVVPKPWEQPHPPKPNEELCLKGPFICALAIYNAARAGTGKNQGLEGEGAGVRGQFPDQGLTVSKSPDNPAQISVCI